MPLPAPAKCLEIEKLLRKRGDERTSMEQMMMTIVKLDIQAPREVALPR
jgi:hypothetical protein